MDCRNHSEDIALKDLGRDAEVGHKLDMNDLCIHINMYIIACVYVYIIYVTVEHIRDNCTMVFMKAPRTQGRTQILLNAMLRDQPHSLGFRDHIPTAMPLSAEYNSSHHWLRAQLPLQNTFRSAQRE